MSRTWRNGFLPMVRSMVMGSCGVVWCDAVWRGAVWWAQRGVVQCGVVRCDMT